MRVVHLYPFEPRGRHGGTLRLLTSAAAFANDDQRIWYWSRDRTWKESDSVDRDASVRRGGGPSGPLARIKRLLFPSTLWESGRAAIRGFDASPVAPAATKADVVVLHTTYLAPLARRLRGQGCRVVVDAYDLVWRAHDVDAGSTRRRTLRNLRLAYSKLVRVRELAAIRNADVVIAAGWQDAEFLRADGIDSAWVPTGVVIDPVGLSAGGDAGGKLTVGFIGNFEHTATRATADELSRSPLARELNVRLLLAGIGSREYASSSMVFDSIGEVSRSESFYELIDCVVVPVVSGAGIKVKIIEAVLAGRPVVTTPMGRSGIPPELARYLLVAPSIDALDGALCRRALLANRSDAVEAFSRAFELSFVAPRYRLAATGDSVDR